MNEAWISGVVFGGRVYDRAWLLDVEVQTDRRQAEMDDGEISFVEDCGAEACMAGRR